MGGFQQAAISVQKEQEFNRLKTAIDRVFTLPLVESFLRELKKNNVAVRDFDTVLARGFIDRADSELKKSGTTSTRLYDAVTLSDKGQIREFYLERLEGVDVGIRAKYAQVYRVL